MTAANKITRLHPSTTNPSKIVNVVNQLADAIDGGPTAQNVTLGQGVIQPGNLGTSTSGQGTGAGGTGGGNGPGGSPASIPSIPGSLAIEAGIDNLSFQNNAYAYLTWMPDTSGAPDYAVNYEIVYYLETALSTALLASTNYSSIVLSALPTGTNPFQLVTGSQVILVDSGTSGSTASLTVAGNVYLTSTGTAIVPINSYTTGASESYAVGSKALADGGRVHSSYSGVKIPGLFQGLTYYFGIRAQNSVGNWSATSTLIAKAMPYDTTAPNVPTGLTATTATKGVWVTWSPQSDSDLRGIVVAVSSNGGANWNLVNSIPTPTTSLFYPYTSDISQSSGTSTTDLSFMICAVDYSGNWSAWTDGTNHPASTAGQAPGPFSSPYPGLVATVGGVPWDDITTGNIKALGLIQAGAGVKVVGSSYTIRMDAIGLHMWTAANYPGDGSSGGATTVDINANGGASFSGTVTASTITGGTINGTTITGGSIDIGSGKFQVDGSGNLTAQSVTITGTIVGSTIETNTSVGGNSSLDVGYILTGSTVSIYSGPTANGLLQMFDWDAVNLNWESCGAISGWNGDLDLFGGTSSTVRISDGSSLHVGQAGTSAYRRGGIQYHNGALTIRPWTSVPVADGPIVIGISGYANVIQFTAPLDITNTASLTLDGPLILNTAGIQNKYNFRVYLNNQQAISAGTQKGGIFFDTIVRDGAVGWHSYYYQVQKAGLYLLIAHVQVNSNVDLNVGITVNTNIVSQGEEQVAGTGNTTQATVTDLVQLNVGDQVQATVLYSGSACTMYTGVYVTYFTGVYVCD